MPATLTIQLYWNGRWHDTGEVRLSEPSRGLLGPMQFYYNPTYILDVADDGFEFTDERAIGVNAPANFTGHYDETVFASILRDIIPQGAGRRELERLWGFDRPTGPGLDYRLLQEACIAPVGNLRIKEAAEPFYERIAQQQPTKFSKVDIAERTTEVIEYAHDLGIAIGGATGAGGDAPKLLLVEDFEGHLYLEGTLDEAEVNQHWLVKFPRGNGSPLDQDILRAEGCFYQALASCGIDTIAGAQLHEGSTPSLWLPRFDRYTQPGTVNRCGVESTYSAMRMLGNGARLQHPDAIAALIDHSDINPDDLLVEYLTRDAINTAIGNTDNHGRNTALLKRDGKVFLSPAFDLAPMALDHEGIARASVWPREYRDAQGNPDYATIIRALAADPAAVANALEARFYELAQLPELTQDFDLPAAVQEHPQVKLQLFEQLWPAMTDLVHHNPSQDLH